MNQSTYNSRVTYQLHTFIQQLNDFPRNFIRIHSRRWASQLGIEISAFQTKEKQQDVDGSWAQKKVRRLFLEILQISSKKIISSYKKKEDILEISRNSTHLKILTAPRLVVELGTFVGYGTLRLARQLNTTRLGTEDIYTDDL